VPNDRPAIRALPGLLIDQIAAGEVIERPASVVKELVENALDAGARQVRVELAGGGVGLIRVRDDGHGIPREELALALGRHCTSKLRALGDLDAIATLGFRGEALPSIASVSRLRLASCVDAALGAFEVTQDGVAALPGEPQPVAHPPGTTVEVRDLFHNVPARRRFLKGERTEFDQVEQFLRRLALSRPEVAFRLEHPGRRGFSVPASPDPAAQRGRLAALMGRAFAECMRGLDARASELSLRGWLAPPEAFAPTHSGLGLWTVNGRVVRDPALARTVRMACAEWLPPGRHPAYCLHLELDPQTLDVNVHPMKLEVRYRDARRVQDFVLSTLREVLQETRSTPSAGEARSQQDLWVGESTAAASALWPMRSASLAPWPAAARRGREPHPGAVRAGTRHGQPLTAAPGAGGPAPAAGRGRGDAPAQGTAAVKHSDSQPGWLAGGRAWVVPAAGGLHVLDPARWLADRAWQALGADTVEAAQLLLPPSRPLGPLGQNATPLPAPSGQDAAVLPAPLLEVLAGLGLRLATSTDPSGGGRVVRLCTLPACLAPLDAGALLDALLTLAHASADMAGTATAEMACASSADTPGVTPADASRADASPIHARPADWRRWLSARFLHLPFTLSADALPTAPAPADASACLPSSPYRPFWHWVPLGAAGTVDEP
jgi:DNA mismatch repair protein MutL